MSLGFNRLLSRNISYRDLNSIVKMCPQSYELIQTGCLDKGSYILTRETSRKGQDFTRAIFVDEGTLEKVEHEINDFCITSYPNGKYIIEQGYKPSEVVAEKTCKNFKELLNFIREHAKEIYNF